MAVSDPVLAALRRPALHPHRDQRPASALHPVRVRSAPEARDLPAEEVLLLQRAPAKFRLGRRDDLHERGRLLTPSCGHHQRKAESIDESREPQQ